MKKPLTEEEKILREGLMDPLEPSRFERLARRIIRLFKVSPEREEEMLKEYIAARAKAQQEFKKTLD